ncbi:hypothetical protein [Gemmatimonas groenlandica]|uniref:DUF4142 domain-containing protein n=1 Tax=Gemmatimonas groenlandica TaxID=2732249 RepID=A0A6M4IHW6_9BACT|nr:hypothetical protein [Gemmatimonas groenlandica]QJR34393.1 hypothetical protein HKW67_02075 [Gemmatimonas groenlandica]
MSLPTSMTTSRVLILSLLAVSGAVVSSTAASVYAAGDTARRLPPTARVAGRVDPLSPAVLAEAADTTRSFTSRVRLLEAIADGACVRTREMLFGASTTRHAALDRAIDAMTGVPNVPDLRRRMHQRLDAFSDGPTWLAAATRATPGSSVPMLRWLLPHTIEARVDYCRTLR